MKQKRPFTTGEKLMTAVMALCLAAACVMGVLFFRVTRENSEAEKEQVLLEQAALATAAPTARLDLRSKSRRRPFHIAPRRHGRRNRQKQPRPRKRQKRVPKRLSRRAAGKPNRLKKKTSRKKTRTLLAILLRRTNG